MSSFISPGPRRPAIRPADVHHDRTTIRLKAPCRFSRYPGASSGPPSAPPPRGPSSRPASTTRAACFSSTTFRNPWRLPRTGFAAGTSISTWLNAPSTSRRTSDEGRPRRRLRSLRAPASAKRDSGPEATSSRVVVSARSRSSVTGTAAVTPSSQRARRTPGRTKSVRSFHELVTRTTPGPAPSDTRTEPRPISVALPSRRTPRCSRRDLTSRLASPSRPSSVQAGRSAVRSARSGTHSPTVSEGPGARSATYIIVPSTRNGPRRTTQAAGLRSNTSRTPMATRSTGQYARASLQNDHGRTACVVSSRKVPTPSRDSPRDTRTQRAPSSVTASSCSLCLPPPAARRFPDERHADENDDNRPQIRQPGPARPVPPGQTVEQEQEAEEDQDRPGGDPTSSRVHRQPLELVRHALAGLPDLPDASIHAGRLLPRPA